MSFWLPCSEQDPPTFRDHLHNVEVAHQERPDLKLVQAAAVRHAAPRGASADLTGHGCDTEASGRGCLGCTQRSTGRDPVQRGHSKSSTYQLCQPSSCPLPSTPPPAPSVTRFGDISSFRAAAHPVMGSLEILDTRPDTSLPKK